MVGETKQGNQHERTDPLPPVRQVAPAENQVVEMAGADLPAVKGEQVLKAAPPPPMPSLPPVVTTAAPVYAAPTVTTTAAPVYAAAPQMLLAADLNHDGVIESNEVFSVAQPVTRI